MSQSIKITDRNECGDPFTGACAEKAAGFSPTRSASSTLGRERCRDPGKPHPSYEERESMAPLASQQQKSNLLTSYDLHLFNEGTHNRLFEKFGAHVTELNGKRGTHFAVWAPNAERLSVVGDFNGWNPDSHPMNPRESSGAWEAFIRDLGPGTVYKYHIRS